MKTLSRTCMVAGGAAVLTALAGVTAAHAVSVTVPDTGTLLVGGAGVSFSVTLDCEAGRTADLLVNVVQKVDGAHVATGGVISDTVTCAAGQETVEVALLAAGHFAFTEGDAAVQILMFTCDTVACESTTVTGQARLGLT
ncbi:MULTISPECIES: hypothetical protein [Micrococcaceae]|uniref:hypothetical protein n=1 Tax=Micrococcaceae TaxID=1268 RepID=UPI00160E6EFC|nr:MULTISPECIES: hypothetical protein [Micrococcaceae]MBB5750328.1 hypothetical protein [Micrococcus sp. TA1]HRO31375.1 hypothetical protein [Citricoccus sp.]HRO95044.1 hypothetical protein [Citricoccus sp.]